MSSANEKSAAIVKIGNINAVEGFDPTPLAVDYADLGNGETRKRLPVMAQIAWFRLKYPEGRIAISVTPGKGCFVAVARVYKYYQDPVDCFLAEASASRGFIADKPTVSPREWAQTAAVGIALRNAGFGLQFHTAGESFDELAVDELMQGKDTPHEATSMPAAANCNKEASFPKMPEVLFDEPTIEEYVSGTVVAATSETATAAPAPAEPEQSLLEKAMRLICPIAKYNGKTLGEVLTLDAGAISWLANKYTNNPEIAAGAKLICEAAIQVGA